MTTIIELTITCILKIIIEISKSKKINDYAYKLKRKTFEINFGLNSGWSIEGFIESSFKIDIPYLGRTIKKINKLKELAKSYQVEILFEYVI